MNLSDPETLRAFLRKYGLAAAKGLGQHFLCSSRVVDVIVGELTEFPGLLEIGPGPGVLTSPLGEHAEKMIAVELDGRMTIALAESAPKVEVVKSDVLEVDLVSLLETLPKPRAIVSNMPYNITGPLLNKIAGARGHIQKAVLMMQKEVAERITAKPGNRERGSLSVFLQSQFDIRFVVAAPQGAFLPPPKVASSVLAFVPRPCVQKDGFYRFVRMGFAQPRKTLANNLIAGQHVARDRAEDALNAAGLDEMIRPHDLSQAQWEALFAQFSGGTAE